MHLAGPRVTSSSKQVSIGPAQNTRSVYGMVGHRSLVCLPPFMLHCVMVGRALYLWSAYTWGRGQGAGQCGSVLSAWDDPREGELQGEPVRTVL